MRKNLQTLKSRLWKSSAYAVGRQFSLADIFVAVIYKRALTQGVEAQAFPAYEAYLRFLFEQEAIRAAAPFAWPLPNA